MKKFKFTLQSLLEYKETVEKSQRDELRRAREVLNKLLEELHSLEIAFELTSKSLEDALQKRIDVVEALKKHDYYFRFLREERDILEEKIIAAEEEKERCQNQLITTMKELKAYSNLREEQYQRYLEEVKREEAKEISDLVAYKTITEEAD